MIGMQFTWAKNLSDPIYEKLDRVLMDTYWKGKFSIVSVRVQERIEGLSDHAPILLSTGTPRPQCNHIFKFELGWLHRERFDDMVKDVWESRVPEQSPLERWNNNSVRYANTFLDGHVM
jgi:hypothetical protein